MPDYRDQLDRAMDDLKEDMIKDIFDVTIKHHSQDIQKQALEMLDISI